MRTQEAIKKMGIQTVHLSKLTKHLRLIRYVEKFDSQNRIYHELSEDDINTLIRLKSLSGCKTWGEFINLQSYATAHSSNSPVKLHKELKESLGLIGKGDE